MLYFKYSEQLRLVGVVIRFVEYNLNADISNGLTSFIPAVVLPVEFYDVGECCADFKGVADIECTGQVIRNQSLNRVGVPTRWRQHNEAPCEVFAMQRTVGFIASELTRPVLAALSQGTDSIV